MPATVCDRASQEGTRCPLGGGGLPGADDGHQVSAQWPEEVACLGNPDPVGMKVYCPTGDETHSSPEMRKALFSQCFSSASREARTPSPRFRSLRRDDFATPEEITKSIVSRCRTSTSESISGFAAVVSFAGEGSEKGTDLRNPQIQVGNPNCSPPERTDSPLDYSLIGPRLASRTSGDAPRKCGSFSQTAQDRRTFHTIAEALLDTLQAAS